MKKFFSALNHRNLNKILHSMLVLTLLFSFTSVFSQDDTKANEDKVEQQEQSEPNSIGKSVSIKKTNDDSLGENDLLSQKGAKEQENLYDFDQRFNTSRAKTKYFYKWSVNLLQEFHYSNNGDLRERSEKTDTEIQYTDDQLGFAVTRAKIDALFTFPKERTGMQISWGFDGVWGHDQLQGFSNPGTRIGRANIFWNFAKSKTFGYWTLTSGRQFYSVGGLPVDYMQKDVLDAITLKGSISKLLDVNLLLLDVYSGAANFGGDAENSWNDEFRFFTRDESEVIEGLNGDTSTLRWGGSISFREAFKRLVDPRLYGFYARVRGNGGGSDRSENGQLGNFSDNDSASLYGGRVFLSLGKMLKLKMFEKLGIYSDVAYSKGSDLRREYEPKADWGALGYSAGLHVKLKNKKIAPFMELDFFQAEGSEYDKNGNLISHGFVSFKGDEVGGLLLRRYWGVHPSAYVDDDGIDDSPFSANKKSGIQSLHLGIGVELFKKLTVRADLWQLTDTGSSAVNFSKLNSISNPYKSPEEIKAQKRLGKSMGKEIDFLISYKPNPLLKFTIQPAIFIPGDFYKDSIAEAVSSNAVPMGGNQDANFFGMVFGTEMRF